jgi:hypothetical protein
MVRHGNMTGTACFSVAKHGIRSGEPDFTRARRFFYVIASFFLTARRDD